MYIVDQFVLTQIGDPFRLLPFGTITKNGRKFEITPESAAQFKLPHFKPAIKLGSHADTTPAGGHIIGLEVREDGLYAVPEWNDNGTSALIEGAYRYHSPEIVWEGELEDSVTGKSISGPIIMGDALLHVPALGEAASFYQVEIMEDDMAENTVTVPQSWFERLFPAREQEPATPPPVSPQTDNYAAQVQTLTAQNEKLAGMLEEYKTEVEELKANQALAVKVASFSASLSGTAVSQDVELLTALTTVDEKTAEIFVQRIKALSAQAEAGNLTDEIGHEGDGHGGSRATAVQSAIDQYMAEHQGVSFNAAIEVLARTKPELFKGVDLS